jgi:hypothetical protein
MSRSRQSECSVNCVLVLLFHQDEFKREFCPAQVAINRLESTTYFQKGRSLDDYIDEFQDLITDSGYTDPKTIVVKFWRTRLSQ